MVESNAQDMVTKLRDFCVHHHHPMPIFDIVSQTGTPDAPQFTVLCALASIKRFGIADNTKDARQKAAQELLNVLKEISKDKASKTTDVVPPEAVLEDVEQLRYKKFNSYFELKEQGNPEMYGIKLGDRHEYFASFQNELKTEAVRILNSTNYESKKHQISDVLEALKIKAKEEVILNTRSVGDPLFFITLNCDYDCCFAGTAQNVYADMLGFFRVMLKD